MKEKIKVIFFIAACVFAVIIMSVWMWPDWKADYDQPWIDRFGSQMK